jgi:predicted AAA+ superfamily ATPase
LVLIEGPKAVGKTESAKRVARKIVRMDIDEDTRSLAKVAPEILLAGEPPVFIDEWQLEPNLWGHIKVESDTRQAKGQFILTGSSLPTDEVTRDTATGRVSRLKIRPMSHSESGNSNGQVSLSQLFKGVNPKVADTSTSMAGITELICQGGWPSVQEQELL